MSFSGITGIDQVLNVLLTTAMFVGGCVAFILDNTIPGMWYISNMLITYVTYFFWQINMGSRKSESVQSNHWLKLSFLKWLRWHFQPPFMNHFFANKLSFFFFPSCWITFKKKQVNSLHMVKWQRDALSMLQLPALLLNLAWSSAVWLSLTCSHTPEPAATSGQHFSLWSLSFKWVIAEAGHCQDQCLRDVWRQLSLQHP